MTATVVDYKTASNSSAFTGPSVSQVAASGDAIVAIIHSTGSVVDVSAMAGCGATWARVIGPSTTPAGSGTDTGAGRHQVWVGTGATGSGTVAVTLSGTNNGAATLEVYTLRGVTNPATVSWQWLNDSASGAISRSITSKADQVVIWAGCVQGGLTSITPSAPATDWTTHGPTTNASSHGYGSAVRVPTESSDTTHTVSMTPASSLLRGSIIVRFGTATAAPPAGQLWPKASAAPPAAGQLWPRR